MVDFGPASIFADDRDGLLQSGDWEVEPDERSALGYRVTDMRTGKRLVGYQAAAVVRSFEAQTYRAAQQTQSVAWPAANTPAGPATAKIERLRRLRDTELRRLVRGNADTPPKLPLNHVALAGVPVYEAPRPIELQHIWK